MKAKKTLNILIIILFILAITLPLVFADYKGGAISWAENRYLAPFPEFFKDGKLHLSRSEINNWINDNVGGRKIATAVNTRVSYSLFKTSAKSDTLIGKDDWMYYYTNDILDDYSGKNLLTQDQLEVIASNVGIIKDYVEDHGAAFQFVIAPDKKTIYPENYKPGIQKADGETRTKQLIDYLSSKRSISCYSLERDLLASKEIGTLYSPRIDNAHWNMLGGYIGYSTIIQSLGEKGLDVSCIPIDRCEITEYIDEGLFNESLLITETAYSVKNERSDSFRLNLNEFDKYPFLKFNSNPDVYKKCYINDRSDYPSLLFIGDSYSQKLFDYLPQSFSKVVFVHTADLEHLGDILEVESFNVVIIEAAERMLDYEFGQFDACVDRIEFIKNRDAEWGNYKNLPIVKTQGLYEILDYIDDTLSHDYLISIDASRTVSFAEGWAIDIDNNSAAGRVFVQVGDHYYSANYGKERASVADAFNNNAFLYSGYTVSLDTNEILQAGKISVHVVSQDESYRYEPIEYHVK